MTDIDVPDWVLEASARAVAANAGEDYDSIGQFAQEVLKSTQYEALRAALSAWVVPVMWKHERCGWAPIDEALIATRGQITYAYTLRQEKPE